MNGTKPWWTSTGIWGGLIAIAAPIVGQVFKVTITAEDQAGLVNLCVIAADLIGGAMAVYGRVAATKQIG